MHYVHCVQTSERALLAGSGCIFAWGHWVTLENPTARVISGSEEIRPNLPPSVR